MKAKGWEKITMQMSTSKSDVASLPKYTLRTITRDSEKYFIMIKESIHQKDVTILNSHVPFNINFKIHETKLIELKVE